MFKIVSILFLLSFSMNLVAQDKVVIISPHRKSIQREFIPMFKKHYKATYKKDVVVEWLDQGGTNDDIRFVKAKYKGNSKTSGIDIFWGGGLASFTELDGLGVLSPYKLPDTIAKDIPASAAGISLRSKNNTWHGAAMSSFGVFFNKRLLKLTKLPEPKTWSDLANPKFMNQVTLTDPRRSGSAKTMNIIILEGMGWQKGWELLTAIAGNTRTFTHSSSDPIKAVESGDAVAAMAIDFYATAIIDKLGKQNVGFTLPQGQTVIDPDPIAILKGAPNRLVAERFVNFVLSPKAQKLLVLPKGNKEGPKNAVLGRMSVSKNTYLQTEGKRLSDSNPFKMKAFLKIDMEKVSSIQTIFSDLLGAVLVDTHKELQKAWAYQVKKGKHTSIIQKLAAPPITKKQLYEFSKKWNDEVFRNKTINTWTKQAKAKYQSLSKG